jgi:hypothetical protein
MQGGRKVKVQGTRVAFFSSCRICFWTYLTSAKSPKFANPHKHLGAGWGTLLRHGDFLEDRCPESAGAVRRHKCPPKLSPTQGCWLWPGKARTQGLLHGSVIWFPVYANCLNAL